LWPVTVAVPDTTQEQIAAIDAAVRQNGH
jgi:hypothetical protein